MVIAFTLSPSGSLTINSRDFIDGLANDTTIYINEIDSNIELNSILSTSKTLLEVIEGFVLKYK